MLFRSALGTAILVFMIFALVDPRSGVAPGLAPLLIGFTVAVLISLFAPITQAGCNPARAASAAMPSPSLAKGHNKFFKII